MQTGLVILVVSPILRTGVFDYFGRNEQSDRTRLGFHTEHRAP